MKFQPKDGQYYYRPYRGKFGVWQHHEDSFGDTFVCDCYSKEDANKKVKELNNWK